MAWAEDRENMERFIEPLNVLAPRMTAIRIRFQTPMPGSVPMDTTQTGPSSRKFS